MSLLLRTSRPVSRALAVAGIVLLNACGGSSTSPSTSPGSTSTMTATINGKSFTAVTTIALRTQVANGTVGVTGNDGFTVPYTILTITMPDAVGTYPLSSTGTPLLQNAEVEELKTTTSGQIWTAGAATSAGSSGTLTLSTLTATGASGTFSFTAVALSPTGASGTRVVTNGKFNVKF
jgi:hypothetical protein